MSTTTQDTTAEPVAGGIVVGRHGNATVYKWTLGTGATLTGLTTLGIARALRATADYLDSLSDAERTTVARMAGSPHVTVTCWFWDIPAVPGHGEQVAALMTEVVNAEGSIGRLPA